MVEESGKNGSGSKVEQGSTHEAVVRRSHRLDIALEEEIPPEVSAKDIPRPATMLSSVRGGKVEDYRVTLVGDPAAVPPLEDIEKINGDENSESRTPLMAVIEALLTRSEGSMRIKDLTPRVKEIWNRPFPTSPYSPDEFVYIIASNSDKLRVEP